MSGSRSRLGERVEVHDDELERHDAGLDQLTMVGETAVGEQTAVDARVERLDAPVEHLGNPVTAATSVTGRPPRAGPAPCRLSTRARTQAESGRERRGRSCPTPTARAARRRHGCIGHVGVEAHPTAVDAERPGHELRHDPRQQLVLGGPDAFMEGGLVIARQDRHRHLGHDRPAIERVVDEVDRAAGDRDTVRQSVTDGVGAGKAGRSDGCVLRMRPGNAARTFGPINRM